MTGTEEFDRYRYERRGSNMCAVLHYRVPYVGLDGVRHTDQAFTRSSLECRLKNLQAGGYASEVTEGALASWPEPGFA